MSDFENGLCNLKKLCFEETLKDTTECGIFWNITLESGTVVHQPRIWGYKC